MKLCSLQDPNMKMCTIVVYPGPSSFPRIMSLKVVFQICFGSIKMMGTRRVLVLSVFSGVRVVLSIVFYVVFCRSLFVLFLLVIVSFFDFFFQTINYEGKKLTLGHFLFSS
jgi:hypothetical protein